MPEGYVMRQSSPSGGAEYAVQRAEGQSPEPA